MKWALSLKYFRCGTRQKNLARYECRAMVAGALAEPTVVCRVVIHNQGTPPYHLEPSQCNIKHQGNVFNRLRVHHSSKASCGVKYSAPYVNVTRGNRSTYIVSQAAAAGTSGVNLVPCKTTLQRTINSHTNVRYEYIFYPFGNCFNIPSVLSLSRGRMRTR